MKFLPLVLVVILFSACEKMSFETDSKDTSKPIQSDTKTLESLDGSLNQNDQGQKLITIKREEWSTTQKKCISICKNTSCAKPPPDITIPPIPALYSDFETNFNNGTLATFFEFTDYSPMWDLSEDTDVTDGIIDGSNRVIKVTTDGIDYFLVGPAGHLDAQIESDPLLVLYLN